MDKNQFIPPFVLDSQTADIYEAFGIDKKRAESIHKYCEAIFESFVAKQETLAKITGKLEMNAAEIMSDSLEIARSNQEAAVIAFLVGGNFTRFVKDCEARSKGSRLTPKRLNSYLRTKRARN